MCSLQGKTTEDGDEKTALEGACDEKEKGVQAFVSVHLCKSTVFKGIQQNNIDGKGGGFQFGTNPKLDPPP